MKVSEVQRETERKIMGKVNLVENTKLSSQQSNGVRILRHVAFL